MIIRKSKMQNKLSVIHIKKANAISFAISLLTTIIFSAAFTNNAFAGNSNYQQINVGE